MGDELFGTAVPGSKRVWVSKKCLREVSDIPNPLMHKRPAFSKLDSDVLFRFAFDKKLADQPFPAVEKIQKIEWKGRVTVTYDEGAKKFVFPSNWLPLDDAFRHPAEDFKIELSSIRVLFENAKIPLGARILFQEETLQI